ncbi:hypothetical protein A6P39_000095 [Streptomyces sp. FXJ1.172]|uniref:hypothetical protein n=1 Tax=Streptomyces sp. FXJ1.172 TaxID=710705 RepID=UPI0007CFCF57|nr:hypothetical protein [Streptomyces sp. FXJ1.172]WEO92659.1 hypothetical protein A6P39_000095 [Streptomyces sp. FXJ1.172]
MSQALALDIDINFARRPKQRIWLHTPYEQVLREAVERLKVEDACGEFHHPDQRLADQIEELADVC